MFNLSERVEEFFRELFDDILSSAFQMITELLFSHEGLTGFFQEAYQVFLGFGSIVLLLIILFKVVQHITHASANGLPVEVGITQVVYRAFLASFLVIILPFMLMWLVGQVVYPLAYWMFGEIGSHTAESVTSVLTSGPVGQVLNGFMLLVLVGFIAIAMIAFIVKVCVYHADLILLTILSVWAAVSVAADENNYASVWWREVLSQVLSIIVQIMLMVGVTEILAMGELTWWNFALLIGFCVLIIRGPSVTRSMWYATGSGRATMNAMGNAGRTTTRLLMAKGLAR
ncbi:conjugal transfer protein TrbL family protein [Thalassorhabdus alkalitolerans]|uniref:Conjugal transfer protein TrbL family protein n=1 Tax=Thalassorhabdus alkalitolerans TaxID=2282697 RepID=A0ABW0YPH5_9BACI